MPQIAVASGNNKGIATDGQHMHRQRQQAVGTQMVHQRVVLRAGCVEDAVVPLQGQPVGTEGGVERGTGVVQHTEVVCQQRVASLAVRQRDSGYSVIPCSYAHKSAWQQVLDAGVIIVSVCGRFHIQAHRHHTVAPLLRYEGMHIIALHGTFLPCERQGASLAHRVVAMGGIRLPDSEMQRHHTVATYRIESHELSIGRRSRVEAVVPRELVAGGSRRVAITDILDRQM